MLGVSITAARPCSGVSRPARQEAVGGLWPWAVAVENPVGRYIRVPGFSCAYSYAVDSPARTLLNTSHLILLRVFFETYRSRFSCAYSISQFLLRIFSIASQLTLLRALI